MNDCCNTRGEAAAPAAPSPSVRHVRTAALLLGPFYPVQKPDEADSDLWDAPFAGVSQLRIGIAGRVIDESGAPIGDARVEIWHADPCGRYPHPSAADRHLVDPHFRGYGVARTDANGHYRFCTTPPGAYRQERSERTPHIHFQVTTATDRLVTQMFFPDDPRNDADRWYRAATRPESLIARRVDIGDAPHSFAWDIVLPQR
jgi:protocatechuate 3,4-dioxygenase beta subunit